MTESHKRERIAEFGKSLYDRGYVHGSTGNISVKLEDGWLITPTNSCMGRLDPARISKVGFDGTHISGDKPSKEDFLHINVYRQRPDASAIVHTHSLHSVAVSCMSDVDASNVLPPLTAYYVMRVGELPLIPYYRPGDPELAKVVGEAAVRHACILLANHGPVVAGKSLDSAVYGLEELEETAKLFLMLEGRQLRGLSLRQIEELKEHFPS